MSEIVVIEKKELVQLFRPLYDKIDSLEATVKELSKKEDKLLTIQQSADLLQQSVSNFKKKKHLIPVAGGTQRKPLYWQSDVLGLREKIKNAA